MENLRILLADDEPIGIMALRAQLEALGHTIVGSARDGREAVELACCRLLDLLILDQRMPEMSGLHAAAHIFRLQPVPVIILTGYAGGDLDDAGPRPPVVHHLTKPIDLHDLRRGMSAAQQRFRQWLERHGDVGRLQGYRAQRERLEAACAERARRDRVSYLEACRSIAEDYPDDDIARLARDALRDLATHAAD